MAGSLDRQVVIIDPNPNQTLPNGTLCYAAVISGDSEAKFNWTVETEKGGSISPTGLYTAPDTPGHYTIKATADGDETTFATTVATVTQEPDGLTYK